MSLEGTPSSHKFFFVFVVVQALLFGLYTATFYADIFGFNQPAKVDLDIICKPLIKECPAPVSNTCPVCETIPQSQRPPKKEYNVISFGIYGANTRYTFGAIRNSEQAKALFPDWKVRWYHDKTVPKPVLDELKSNGDELVDMSRQTMGAGGVAGMLWRFLVAADPKVDHYMIRDADARFNIREKAAVDEWKNSGLAHHILKDHPAHAYDGTYPILGGMWGGKGALPGFAEKLKKWSDKQNYMGDMNFLRAVFDMFNKTSIMSHDTWTCERYPYARPFPTRRFVSKAFVEHSGQVFSGDDEPVVEHMDGIRNQPAPLKCRGKPHWKWG